MKTIDEKRQKEIEGRAAKATAGPWLQAVHVDEPRALVSITNMQRSLLALDSDDMAIVGTEADAAFIAHARADIPDLLAWGRAAEERAAHAEAEMQRLRALLERGATYLETANALIEDLDEEDIVDARELIAEMRVTAGKLSG